MGIEGIGTDGYSEHWAIREVLAARTFLTPNGFRHTSRMSNAGPAPVHSSEPSGAEDEQAFSYRAELQRKALHFLALLVPLGMHALGRETALTLLLPLTCAAVAADILRARSASFNQHIRRVFGPLMRAKELPPVGSRIVINGATSVLVAATLLTLFVPLEIGAPILAMTMIADAAAALVGRAIGRHRWPGRRHTVEGSVAFLVTGGAVVFSLGLPWIGGAAAVVSAAVVEAAPMPVNDNIAVPLVAALVAWGIG